MHALLILAVLSVVNVQSSGVAPKIKLNDGREIPALGLGTWLGFTKDGGRVQAVDDSVQKAVEWAIDAGYRHIDTAYIYNTEDQVGRAVNNKIAEGVVKREDLFLTTKLWNDCHAKESVVPALRRSLEQLHLDYIDLYLIHWPVPEFPNRTLDNIDYVETWHGMIEAKNLGLAKSIGVSNFNKRQLDRIQALSPVVPSVLQVEINLNLQQPELLAYCKQKNIAVTGYSPFGSLFDARAKDDAPPPRGDDPALVAIAGKYNKTVPQLALRYEVELGVIPIPKSTTKTRIEQNINVFDFSLTQEEKDKLKSYDRGYRIIPAKYWVESPYYPFEK